MAQIAKPEAERASANTRDAIQNVAEQGKQAADVTREAADRAEDLARHSLHAVERTVGAVAEVEHAVARRSVEGTAELGRVLVDLTVTQTRQNLETLRALSEAIDWDQVAKAVDWEKVLQLQSEYLRTSLERAAEITRRYLEVTQTVVSAAAAAAQREAQKAA